MNELGINAEKRLNGKSLDLGSLRPGGATWILQQTEDGEFTRRRGRWLNERVMNIYIQEVSASIFVCLIRLFSTKDICFGFRFSLRNATS